ncbi:MAG: YbaB/EbfC family nucleoid-associated protein [Pirellulales bacterium]
MFKGLGQLANLANVLKQAQQMGGKMEQMLESLKGRRAEGAAGGGLVTVEVNGLGEVLRCAIDPSLANDREMVEDLLPAAINQALAKAKQMHAEEMKALAGGVDLPGLNDMLAQLSGGTTGGPTV